MMPLTGRVHGTKATAIAFRLTPGEDLRAGIEAAVDVCGLQAAAILTCVGSLRHLAIRLADESMPEPFVGPFEIVSLTGTLGAGGAHLHVSVADASGWVRGGHLRLGSQVHTTAEIVVVSLLDLCFLRQPDIETGFNELSISRPPGT